jgi:hypothetical protein
MNKSILNIVFCVLCFSVRGQVNDKIYISGSWINTDVSDVYESGKSKFCDIKYFGDSSRFVPLFLSFESGKELRITFRIEQPVLTYRVLHSCHDSISISRGLNTYKIYIFGERLRLRYNNNWITFRKVANSYSNDVFGEFIKDGIFKSRFKYTIDSFAESNNYNNAVVNRNNFQQTMKEIFNCEQVEIVTLGTFKFGEFCLPEVAIYYNRTSKRSSPRVLGIDRSNNNINLIDSAGFNVVIFRRH